MPSAGKSAIISARVSAWRDAWQSLDPARIAALYAPDGIHESSKVRSAFPDNADGRLSGPEAVRRYAERAARQFSRFEILPLRVIEDGDCAAVEYVRRINGDPASDMRVMEVLEWAGPLLRHVRVYHF
ncbi:MAG: nuclear transport factor 2 family protein [Hyphomicrobiaceae bacterium]|nr:MAG: nuclear transport factor 2 family protein [Hyphomicrobiaceae bacterium]